MLTALQMLDGFAAGSLSPVDAVEACADAIAARDGELHAFTALCLDRAREEARAAERAWARGEPTGPLCGVPLGVKDLFDTNGVETAYGSPLYAGNVPARDAEAVARARRAGAIVVGKTRTHEFAWGMTMRHARLGPARNPHDPRRTPGGSSGGSAVAVAAGMVPVALGSDTGGSIRLPAALCGVVGLKPTHGAVPLDGVWPLVPEFDHAGPITTTPQDAALLFEALAERSLPPSPPQLRAGIHVADDLAPAVVRALESARDAFEARPVTLSDGLAAYFPIFNASAVRTHTEKGLWPGRPDAHDPTVRVRLEIAARTTAAEVAAAREEKARIAARTAELFETVDVVISAICAVSPPPLLDSEDDLRRDVTRLVCLQDLLGLPAVAVPVSTDPEGMPVGVQITGRRDEEHLVLAAAQRLSEAMSASPSSIEMTGR